MSKLSTPFKSALYFDGLVRFEIEANETDVNYPEKIDVEELASNQALLHIDGRSLIAETTKPIRTDLTGRMLLNGLLRHYRGCGIIPSVYGQFEKHPKSYFLVFNYPHKDGSKYKLFFAYINGKFYFYKESHNA